MRINVAVVVVAVLLAATLTLLGYLWIDRSVSSTYLAASHDSLVATNQDLVALLASDWVGLSEERLIEKLELVASNLPSGQVVIKREPELSQVWFNEIRFRIDKGRVSRLEI